MSLIADFFEALRFLTIIPIPQKGPGPSVPGSFSSSSLARSMFFFPLAGLLIGAVTLGIYFLFQSYLPASLTILILLTTPIFLSGGLHLDGFADFVDGFGGGKNKEDILRIMKDSHIGTFGAAGIVLLLLAKYQMLLELPSKEMVFLMALASSRWVQVVLCFFLPPANPSQGLAKEVAQKVGVRELTGASIFLFLMTVWLQGLGLVLFVGLVLFSALIGWIFYQRLGGITGDLIGAASEMTELMIYFLAVLL
ncbi:MAG: adenosylcobinamide-GDP ribazoletransferase [Candidatus Omnitrophica bacterium]|nr:adenosylcobinamide-GDP ribazoletransferase [Candidatus Omnitrophota bacterium]